MHNDTDEQTSPHAKTKKHKARRVDDDEQDRRDVANSRYCDFPAPYWFVIERLQLHPSYRDLSGTELRVLYCLVQHTNAKQPKGSARPSTTAIMHETGNGRRTVRSALATLKRVGLIVAESHRKQEKPGWRGIVNWSVILPPYNEQLATCADDGTPPVPMMARVPVPNSAQGTSLRERAPSKPSQVPRFARASSSTRFQDEAEQARVPATRRHAPREILTPEVRSAARRAAAAVDDGREYDEDRTIDEDRVTPRRRPLALVGDTAADRHRRELQQERQQERDRAEWAALAALAAK